MRASSEGCVAPQASRASANVEALRAVDKRPRCYRDHAWARIARQVLHRSRPTKTKGAIAPQTADVTKRLGRSVKSELGEQLFATRALARTRCISAIMDSRNAVFVACSSRNNVDQR